jgi:hypothetical protein
MNNKKIKIKKKLEGGPLGSNEVPMSSFPHFGVVLIIGFLGLL